MKNVFLKISQNSQEYTCARVSFLAKLQAERETDRQTGRQTDRQTERDRQRETDRERCQFFFMTDIFGSNVRKF